MSGPVKTERMDKSPAERARRIRRCWAALKQGATKKDLERSGRFTGYEIDKASALMREAGE